MLQSSSWESILGIYVMYLFGKSFLKGLNHISGDGGILCTLITLSYL